MVKKISCLQKKEVINFRGHLCVHQPLERTDLAGYIQSICREALFHLGLGVSSTA